MSLYTLRKNAGVETGFVQASQSKGPGGPENRDLSLDPSVERGSVNPSSPTRPRSARSPYEVWEGS